MADKNFWTRLLDATRVADTESPRFMREAEKRALDGDLKGANQIVKNGTLGTAIGIGTAAAVPFVASEASLAFTPYVATQASKVLLPALAYEVIDTTAKKGGHDSAEHAVLDTALGNSVSKETKDVIAPLLSFAIPSAPTKKVVGIAERLTPKAKDFYRGLAKGFFQYDNIEKDSRFLSKVLNRGKHREITKNIPNIQQILENKAIVNDFKPSNHTYHWWQGADGKWTIYLNADNPNDPTFAGAKAAAEAALAKGTGSMDGASVFIPRELQTLFNPHNEPNNLKRVSQVMASKITTGVESRFDDITEEEMKKVAAEGWKRKIWNPANADSFEEWWRKNNIDIKKLLKRVPVVTGVGILAAQNEKGDQ